MLRTERVTADELSRHRFKKNYAVQLPVFVQKRVAAGFCSQGRSDIHQQPSASMPGFDSYEMLLRQGLVSIKDVKDMRWR
jgi:hypothetical protein